MGLSETWSEKIVRANTETDKMASQACHFHYRLLDAIISAPALLEVNDSVLEMFNAFICVFMSNIFKEVVALLCILGLIFTFNP